MRKRIFCLILSCIMALGIMPLTAFALELQKVAFIVTEPVIGNTPDYSIDVEFNPYEFRYEIINVSWWKSSTTNNPSVGGWTKMDTGEKFEAGFYYQVEYLIMANPDEHLFSPSTEVYINGSIADRIEFDDEGIGAVRVFDKLGEVTNIDVTVNPPVIGETPDFKPQFTSTPAASVLTLPENITIRWFECTKESYESDENAWRTMSNDDEFKSGYYYRVAMTFDPKDGYYFTKSTAATVNGMSDDITFGLIIIHVDKISAHISATFTPLTPIPVTNIRVEVDKPVIGNSPNFIPAEYNASINGGSYYEKDIIELKAGSLKWYESENENGPWAEMTDSDTFNEGYYYRIDAEFEPHTGYCFTTDTKATVNEYRHTGDRPVYDKDSTYAYVSRTFGPLRYGYTDVTSIAATIDTPVIGEKPDYEPSITSDPADSVEVYDVKWYKADKENLSYDSPLTELGKDEKFEEGYYYIIQVTFWTKYGYSLDSMIKPTINGMYNGNGAFGETNIDTFVLFEPEKPINVDKPITSIDVTFDEPTLGGKLNFKPKITTDPADSAYQISYSFIWFKCDKESYENDEILYKPWNYQSDGDVFEEGYYYSLDLYVKAHDGFYFTADREGAINGVPYDVANNLNDNEVSFKAVYGPFSTEPITSIAAEVDEPALGNTPDYSPEITSAPDDSAELFKAIWYKLPEDKYTGTANDSWELVAEDEEFKEGFYYSVLVGAVENDGFYFTEDTTATLNGKTHVDTLGPVYSDDYEDRVARIYGVFERLHSQIIDTYTITFDAGNGASPEASLETDADGRLPYLPNASRSGYSFDGWYLEDGTEVTLDTVFTENSTVYAHWSYKASSSDDSGSTPYYRLSFNTNGGSSISNIIKVSGTTVDLEDFEPKKEGYKFTGWYSDSDLTDEITSIKLLKDATVYAGWKRAEENTVTENPAEESKYELPFKDVNTEDWFFDDVAYVYENGLMSGISTDTFAPNATTTRGMIVTILYRIEGEPEITDECPFSDVADGSYYEKAITWAAENGIVSGYGNGIFGPDDNITREQLAAILFRYAKFKGADVSIGEDTNILSYNDALNISEYAFPAMQWACGEGILSGIDGNLVPNSDATRAQAAAALHRFLENVLK